LSGELVHGLLSAGALTGIGLISHHDLVNQVFVVFTTESYRLLALRISEAA
jgi:hypothetical protein